MVCPPRVARLVFVFVVAACDVGLTTSAFDDKSLLMESWRPTALRPAPALIAAGEAACRERQDGGDLPLVVTDARGERRIQFVFADESNVATCRFWLNEDGSISVDAHLAGPLEGVGEADSDGITIEYSRGTGTGEEDDPDNWDEQLIVGRVDPSVAAVSVRPQGHAPLVASLHDGWYTAWWPKLHTRYVVAASDSTGALVAEDSVGFDR